MTTAEVQLEEPVPVFVIALRSGPRSGALCGQLTQMNIPFEVVDATEGNLLGGEALQALYDERGAIRRVGRAMAAGEIGCALSHRSIYRTIIERGIPLALILEEDAIAGPELRRLWQASRALPAAIEVLLLYAESGFVRRQPAGSLGGCGLHEATLMLSSTVGYFVRHAGAVALLRRGARISMVADWPLDLPELRQFLAIPMPVAHDGATSTIASGRPNLNLLGRFCAPRWLSALFHLTYLGYVLRPGCYQGPSSYYRREVARRVKKMVAPQEIDVSTLRLPHGDGRTDVNATQR